MGGPFWLVSFLLLPVLPCFYFFYLLYSDLYLVVDNPMVMEACATLPTRRVSEDAYDVSSSLTVLVCTGKIKEIKNEINCMNDSRDFQDAESVRSGTSHVTIRPMSIPPHPIPEGMLSRFLGMPSRREGPPSIWDTHGILANIFANPGTNWINGVHRSRSCFIHPQWIRVRGEHKIKIRDASLDRQPEIQSFSFEEILQRILGQTINDCRFQIFILTSSLRQQPLLAGR